MAHTPGPWTVKANGNHGYKYAVAAEDGRLIAAAPELLEALKIVSKWHATAPIDEIEAVERAIEWNFPQAEIEAAIAKAEG